MGLMGTIVKLVDFLRLAERFNKIYLTLLQSIGLLLTFLGFLIIFNIILTPLAQAVWGTYFIGYKTAGDAIVSVFLIAYSKGNLDQLLDYNVVWSCTFLIVYYIMGIFVLHAAFHMTQTDALMSIVLLYSLPETDVVKEKVIVEDKDIKLIQYEKKMDFAFVVTFWVMWLFGWLDRE